MFEKVQKLVKAVFKQEYAKASIYYVIANIIGQGIVLLSSAIFTRMMSKADYGLVSTYSTWVLVLNAFICLNLFITVRTAYIDYKNDYDNYNSSVMLLCIISGLAVTSVITIAVIVSGLNFSIEEVLLACIQSIGLNMVNYMLAIQSMKNEYKQRAFLMIAPNWAHVILSIVLMLIFTQSMYMVKISGNAFGLLAFGIGCVIILAKRAKPRIIPKYWKYALIIALPSVFNTLSDLILMQSDRLMLTSMVGPEETAEYSVIYNVSSIIIVIYQAINGAWTPWFYKKVTEGNTSDTRWCQGLYMLGFSVFTCGMMTISPELIKIISPSYYWHGISYVGSIVIASYLIFLYAFFSIYLLYEKRTGVIAVNTVIAAILNLVLNYFLIPEYKAVGAVIATVVSYMVLFFLHFFAVTKNGRKYFDIGRMWLNIAGITVYGVAFYYVRDLWLVRYLMFLSVVVFLYCLRGKRL